MRLLLLCVALAMTSTVTASPKHTCPTGAELADLARRAFPDARFTAGDLVCHAVRASVPTWLLTFADDQCGLAGAGASAIVQDGVVTWHEPTDVPGTPCRGGTWQPVDLDGDGTDELLHIEEYQGHEGSGHRTLAVVSIANGEPAERSELVLASRGSSSGDHQYTWNCSASYRLVRGSRASLRIEVVGHGGGPQERCHKAGHHVYAWMRRTLVEQ